MCPAIPNRRKATPYLPQNQLKKPRTQAVLRQYAKKRAAYNASAALVFCIYISYYLPAIREWRKEQRRIAARPANKLRQRKHRQLVRLLARIARLEERRAQLAIEIAQYKERVRLKAWHLRKRATAQAGFSEGWTATSPLSEAELKAQSYSRRFIDAYLGAVAERQLVEAAMNKQQTPVIQTATIKL